LSEELDDEATIKLSYFMKGQNKNSQEDPFKGIMPILQVAKKIILKKCNIMVIERILELCKGLIDPQTK
jgi:hypothetical protein